MSSVTFSPSVGGDGSTVTDDTNPSTGLDAGGHRTRFVPALAQVVAVAGNVVTKANDAAASAAAAAASATAATTNGAAQVALAANQVTLAAAQVSAAQAAANAAAASYDSFDDRYLGAKSSAPSVDNDGNALVTGAMYFDSTLSNMRIWNGASWGAAAGVISPDFSVSRETQTATAGQTVFALTNSYTVGLNAINVFVNGVRQFPSAYTETDISHITFSTGLNAGDVVLFEMGVVATGSSTSAGNVTFSPTAGISSTNVQAAIAELDAEKQAVLVSGTDYIPPSGGKLTGAIDYANSASIASATTTDIGAATSNVITVTGTTTITGLGTIAAGAERCVTFAGALTLTHNATSLILPGGANITTAAGDVAYFVSLGSGNWRCSGYQKANGNPVVAPAAGLTATGTAYETIAKGDALAWRTDGSGKIEKVQRRRIIPWADVGTHQVQDCPHVTGPGNINFSANSGCNNVQYSIYDDTVLCAWQEVALGVLTYAFYVCVGKIQADGSVNWGLKTVLTNANSAASSSFGFQVVLLSTTLAGVISGSSSAMTIYYDKLVISGTVINNVPTFATTISLSYGSYLGNAGCYLNRASSTVAMFHLRPNSGSTGQYGYIDFNALSGSAATYTYSGVYIGYSGATVNGDNGFAGVLFPGSGSYMYLSTLRNSTTLNTQAVNAEGVSAYGAIAYDGSRYAVIAYVKSANGYTYAKCYDAQSNVFGAEVQVYAGSLNNTDSMAYDSANSCFYLSTQALTGRVFTITNSGTTLTVGTNYQYTAPFYGITAGNNMSVNSYFSNFVSGTTNKQFVCSAATALPYMYQSGYEQSYTIHRLVIIPHSPTNARNFCGIAEAAAVANGSVTFTPDGGVTSSVSGLTANQQAMLSVDGVVGTSGYVQAGFAYSATSMRVCAAKNDFSRKEIILYSKVWMPPPYVSRVRLVELTGGGAGAYANNATGFSGQGGQTVSGYVSITPNAGCSVVIGAGGTSSTTQNVVTDGGVSSFASSSGILATAVGGRKWVDSSNYLDRPGFLPWQNQGDLERRNGDTTTAYNSSIVESGGVAGSGRPGYGQAGGWNYAAATYRVTNGRQGVCIIEY